LWQTLRQRKLQRQLRRQRRKSMKFIIRHEIRGRIRVQACVRRMSIEEADTLQYYLDTRDFVTSAKYSAIL